MQRVRRDQFVYAFAPDSPPVLTIDPGEHFVVETYDASTGRIRRPEDLAAYLAVRDPCKVNPAGGPIAIRGARSGDELVVSIERIGLTDQGYIRASPGGPFMPDLDGPRVVIVPVEENVLLYPGGIRLPIRPMIGVIGTAPARGVVQTADPAANGSNLDCNAIRVGSRVHLPVNVAGALLCIGDVHASMGDGEVSGTGVEINGEVEAFVNLLTGSSHGWPWVETDDEIIAVASAATVDAAVALAVDRLTRLLNERYAISRSDAFLLVSARGDVHVGQCCGGLDATAYVSFPRT